MAYLQAEPEIGTRQDHLFLVLDNLLDEHKAWADGPESQLNREDGFYRAVVEVLEMFGDGDIPGPLRVIERSIAALGDQWQEYLDRVDQFGDPNALPNGKFWKLIEQLAGQREEAAPGKKFHIEPIADLIAQKVTHAQICKIYGWVDRQGRPELWKLQEELKRPGTHVGPDFVPPHEQKRRAAEARQRELARDLQAKINRKVKQANEPARESVETLGRQGVFIRQIAKMKKMRPDQVIAELTALGVDPVPPMDAADALARAGAVEHPEGEIGDARRRVEDAVKNPLRPARGEPEFVPEAEYAAEQSPADATGDDEDLSDLGAQLLEEEGDAGMGDALAELDASDQEAASLGEQLGGVTIEQEIIDLYSENKKAGQIASTLGVNIGKVNSVISKYRKDPAAFAGKKARA